MKSILLTIALCIMSLSTHAQSEPIALEYAIGAFRIPANLDQKINNRFAKLDPNQTYKVTIVGSADYLGSKDNNQVLSNKRVKFAEYHLLKKYRNLRLILKLDSKGELYADERAKTSSGVQDHRMVYIYIEDYDSAQFSAPVADAANSNDAFNGRTIATAAAAAAEGINNIPVSVSQMAPRVINSVSETAQIEIQRQKQREAIQTVIAAENTPDGDNGDTVHNSSVVTAPAASATVATSQPGVPQESGSLTALSVEGNKGSRKFETEGTFTVGEKLLLSDLNFRPGSHYLRPSSIPTLRKLIGVLEANPALKIEIIGHICCHPDYSPHTDGYDREAGDNKLSYNRADNIKEYLEKNGIDGSRLSATGMGARERIVYPEETEADRITNRRVEIKIISI